MLQDVSVVNWDYLSTLQLCHNTHWFNFCYDISVLPSGDIIANYSSETKLW